jgi:tRNA modification GTPase
LLSLIRELRYVLAGDNKANRRISSMTTAARIQSRNRNVFSQATSSGVGGIATLLLDGADALALLQTCFKPRQKLASLKTSDPIFGRIVDAADRVIDEVVVSALNAKQSPTGNSQIELSCHGGVGVLAAIEAVLCEAGFEKASGTELLERAHLNGKLSLIQAEARLLLSRAVTARQADFLLSHSPFQQRWERFGFDMAFGLRESRTDWREPLIAAVESELAKAKPAGALLKSHHIVIVGPVNAGKSTLTNLLARSQRHIVSDTPGTTLDRLDVPISIRGLSVLLSDTAGLRESENELEREGQRRARDAAASASLRIAVLDGSVPPQQENIQFLEQTARLGPLVLLLNKSDLGVHEGTRKLSAIIGAEAISLSAREGAGLQALEQAIESMLLGSLGLDGGAPFTLRQIEHIERLHRGLKEGIDGAELVICFRKLIGTRPDPDELRRVVQR